ncbi:hypothetical protein FACS189421_14260 [Bacteroidia bacterium]|nr:hypothetical protein FACS189421_14260 [Bacteroidia bacterium]
MKGYYMKINLYGIRKVFTALLIHCSLFLIPLSASAYDYSNGRWAYKLTGYGTVGSMLVREDTFFPMDWRLRGQFNYAAGNGRTVGAVYAVDQLAIDTKHLQRELFAFLEDSSYGRMEIGLMDGIATKLGVGLPDVGGLRLNDYSNLYGYADGGNPLISNLTAGGSRYALRATIASLPTNLAQYGMSFAPKNNHFDYQADVGLKIREPDGKTKTSWALGASFANKPRDLAAEIYAPRTTADWRAQASVGFNLQYNSLIWGTSARVIYDKNPLAPSDGISAGTGISYDFLEYTASVSYIFSDVGIWGDQSFQTHTGIASVRYKYGEYIDIWMSGGAVSGQRTDPFAAAGIRLTF